MYSNSLDFIAVLWGVYCYFILQMMKLRHRAIKELDLVLVGGAAGVESGQCRPTLATKLCRLSSSTRGALFLRQFFANVLVCVYIYHGPRIALHVCVCILIHTWKMLRFNNPHCLKTHCLTVKHVSHFAETSIHARGRNLGDNLERWSIAMSKLHCRKTGVRWSRVGWGLWRHSCTPQLYWPRKACGWIYGVLWEQLWSRKHISPRGFFEESQ